MTRAERGIETIIDEGEPFGPRLLRRVCSDSADMRPHTVESTER